MHLTVSKSPDVHVLSARRGEIKTCNRGRRTETIRTDSGSVYCPAPQSAESVTVWTHRRTWRTTGWAPRSAPPPTTPSSSLHRSPRESEADCGRTCCTSLNRKNIRTSTLTSDSEFWRLHVETFFVFFTCHEDGHVETLDVLWDAAAGRLRWRRRIMSGNTTIIISNSTTQKNRHKTWDVNLVFTLKTLRQRSSPELWRPPSWWTPTADRQTQTDDLSCSVCFIRNLLLIIIMHFISLTESSTFYRLSTLIKSDLFERCDIKFAWLKKVKESLNFSFSVINYWQ